MNLFSLNQLTVSLWGDEAFSVILSQKSIPDIIRIASHDTAPPLYYILLHFWMMLFGSSEIAVRSLSALCFLLLCLSMFFFVREVYNKSSAYFASILVLCNPFLFLYAFEARMYMLLVLFTTLSMWFLMTKRWKLYVLVTVAALYTHHFALFVVLAQTVGYLCSSVDKNILSSKNIVRYFQKNSHFFLSISVLFLLYFPWIPVLYFQSQRVSNDFWLTKPHLVDLRALYENYLALGKETILSQCIILCSMVLLFTRGFQRKKDSMIYIWLFFPPIFTFIFSLIAKPLFFDRYLIECAPAVTILLATTNKAPNRYFFSRISQPIHAIMRPIQVALVCVIIWGLINIDVMTFYHPSKEPFQAVGQFIRTHYGKNQVVVNYYTDRLHYFELKYYAVHVKIYSPLPLPFWVGTALIKPADVLAHLPQTPTLLIMASGAVEDVVVPGYTLTQKHMFHDLYIYTYNKSI